jgi:hypothetical protein
MFRHYLYRLTTKLQFSLFRLLNNNDDLNIPSDIKDFDKIDGYEIYGNYYGLYNRNEDYNLKPFDDLDRCAMIHDLELLNAENRYQILIANINLVENIIKTLRLRAKDDSPQYEKLIIFVKRMIIKCVFIPISLVAIPLFFTPNKKNYDLERKCQIQQMLLNNGFRKYLLCENKTL